jgi:hypothetical protein
MMKKLILLLLACAVCVWAADFWTSKPYTDWNSKELQKILTDSPWAHKVDVELKVTMPTTRSQSEGGGRSRGGAGAGGLTSPDGSSSVANGGGDVRGGLSSGPPGPGSGPDGPVTQIVPVMLSWQTALPVKQALAKAKYGAEVTTSAEAKTFLEREEQYYVISLAGMPGEAALAVDGDKKAAVLQLTALNIKGKEPIRAVEIQISRREKLIDALFFFPRTNPISADDKDLEFSTKFDKLAVKYHFKLKDMVYHGKLEM